MLSSIHPLGERARHNRWGITIGAYVVGAVASGATIGAGLGFLGDVTIAPLFARDGRLAVAALIVVTAGVLDAARMTPPGPARQVDEDWIGAYRGWVYGGGFGVQLGAGLATFVVTWGVYAVLALSFLSADPVIGASIGGVFGLGRSIVPLAAGWIDRPSRLQTVNRRMADLASPVARAATGGTIGLGAIALVSSAL